MRSRFAKLYPRSDSPRIVRAPGRVNLIGEHTDYNLGFVLPVALELETQVAAAPSNDDWIRIYSANLACGTQIRLDDIVSAQPRSDWTDYAIGIVRELHLRGYRLRGQNLLVESNIPQGAGLSSSAALEVGIAMALAPGADAGALAELCLAAEVDFAGVPCAIMDQFACLFSEAGSAMLLDCQSLVRRAICLPEHASWLIVNSGVRHALGASAYRRRVEECAEALRAIRAVAPGVGSLRDATLDHLKLEMSDTARRRARHVITEDARVLALVEAVENADLTQMGTLMTASHKSLTVDYDVSCAELDTLVDIALAREGVHGARMTGGGFGGCIVVLLNENAVAGFLSSVPQEYESRTGQKATPYRCNPSAAASAIP